MNLRTTIIAAAAAATFLSVTVAPAVAMGKQVPTIPLRAGTYSGTGCFVLDANLVYHNDPTCTWHAQAQAGSDREILRMQYRDHGRLPANAAFPTSTVRLTRVVDCACPPGTPYTEIITPSGEYRSECNFRAGDEPIYFADFAELPPDPREKSRP